MSVPEDTYLNRIPYTLTHALKGDLDPRDGWKQLFMAVESSNEDGPCLDPDFKDQLELCNLRRESPTEKLLSELGHKGYRVRHLRVWLRAKGLIRAADLLEGGDRTTGRVPVQRSPSDNESTWMFEPPSEHHHSRSAEGRGGGQTISVQSDSLTRYGSHAESERSETEGGGGGGTIELGVESVTSLGSTQQPESESEGESVGVSTVDRPSNSGGAGVMEGPSESEGASAVDGPSSSDDAGVVKRSSKLEVPNKSEGSKTDELNSLRPVSMADASSQHAVFRKRNEEAKPVSHTPSSEDHSPLEGEGGPYHRHDLVGSGNMRHRGTTASGGGNGSGLKEKAEPEASQPLPLAPPPSTPNGVGWCTMVVVIVIVVWIAALCIAVYNRQ